jgi:hypothetical protein
MAHHRQSLKALRHIALAHCRGQHPDLATLARELGSAVRCHAAGLDALASRVRIGSVPMLRSLRTGTRELQLLLVAWPADYTSPLHDHGARWGLEIPLHGALEVEAWRRQSDGGEPLAHGRHWLGPGDALWFDADQSRLHRCRNLSGREAALSLHLFGGAPANGLAYAPTASSTAQLMPPSRPTMAGSLLG